MDTKINKVKKTLQNMQMKVVEVTETNYTLENGDIYEHTFDIDSNMTVEKFQVLLDNARETVLSTLNKIEKNEI